MTGAVLRLQSQIVAWKWVEIILSGALLFTSFSHNFLFQIFTLVSYECFIYVVLLVKTQVYLNKNSLLEKLLTYCGYNYHYAIES